VTEQRKQEKERKLGRKSSMTDERWDALDDLGFEFEPKSMKEKMWLERFEEMKQYQMKNGHCRVPRSVKPLGKWVNHQREGYKDYKRGSKVNSNGGQARKMTKERVELLEAIGFEWSLK
jgi:Helicase associated domain